VNRRGISNRIDLGSFSILLRYDFVWEMKEDGCFN